MQAILVRYLGPTNSRGSRFKASCDRGSVTIPYPYAAHRSDAPRQAAQALVDRFLAEDAKTGTPPEQNPWGRPMVSGGLPNNGGTVFVFPGEDSAQVLLQCRDEDDARHVRDGVAPERQLTGVRLGLLRDAVAASKI